MDPEEGEVDGDVVMEEPKLGYHASHKFASYRRFTRKPLLGINCWTLHQLEEDPPIRRGSVVFLKPHGQICTTTGFPPISANQRRLLLSAL